MFTQTTPIYFVLWGDVIAGHGSTIDAAWLAFYSTMASNEIAVSHVQAPQLHYVVATSPCTYHIE